MLTLNSTCSAFQSNLKLPMRFICMTWPLHNILFKVLDEDSLSWKFTALAIKSKSHKWSSKSSPCDSVQNAVLAIKWYCLSSPTVLLLFFQVADASYLLIMQKQAAWNGTLWKLTEQLWNSICNTTSLSIQPRNFWWNNYKNCNDNIGFIYIKAIIVR